MIDDPHAGTRTLRGLEILTIAENIAQNAHGDQKDKAGALYIGHPERVAQMLLTRFAGELGQILAAIGWLHDVLEDTPVTIEHLYDNDLPAAVVRAVEALTRREGQTASQYYLDILMDPLARTVKLVDVEDNTDPRRLTLLDEATQVRLIKKYARALFELSD